MNQMRFRHPHLSFLPLFHTYRLMNYNIYIKDEKKQKRELVNALKAAENNKSALVANIWRTKVKERQASKAAFNSKAENVGSRSDNSSEGDNKTHRKTTDKRRMSVTERIAQNSMYRRSSATESGHLVKIEDTDEGSKKIGVRSMWAKKKSNTVAVFKLTSEMKELDKTEKSDVLKLTSEMVYRWRKNAKMKSTSNTKQNEDADKGYHTD
jgi:hypothetical protein